VCKQIKIEAKGNDQNGPVAQTPAGLMYCLDSQDDKQSVW